MKFKVALIGWSQLMLVFTANAQNQGVTDAELGFTPGEIMIIPSPQSESIEDLALATFQGVLRLGQPQFYSDGRKLDRNQYNQTMSKRKALEFRLKEDLQTFFTLYAIKAAPLPKDLDAIKASYVPGAMLENTNITQVKHLEGYWAVTLKNLAARTFMPPEFSKYFCKDATQCLPLHMPKNSGSYQQKIRQAIWGGRLGGEFKEMKAFQAFMDNDAQTFLDWSASIILEQAYMVGKVSLGEYDFNAGGFLLKGLSPIQAAGGVTIEYAVDQEESIFKPNYTAPGQSYQKGILVKMDPEKAETFIKELQAKGNSRQLFYVYKVKLSTKLDQQAYDNTNYHLMIKFYQQPLSRTIEFYYDDALTDKLFEIQN